MMNSLEMIGNTKLIAIARGIYGSDLILSSKALYDGGVRAFEVTFVQSEDPEAARKNALLTAESISALKNALPGAAVGAGTVMTAEQAETAFGAGAGFIISPNTDEAVIKRTKALGMVSIPGAMTPTEIVTAYELGADIVKVFPAGVLGVEYFKAVRAPLSHIPLAAVAGITKDNIALFERAGAAAYGISSSLYIKDAIREGNFDRIRRAAEEFFLAMKK